MGPLDLAEFVAPLVERFSSERVTVMPAAGLSVAWGNLTAGNLADHLFAVFQQEAGARNPALIPSVAGMLGAKRQIPSPPRHPADYSPRYVTDQFGHVNDQLEAMLGKGGLLYGVWKLGEPDLKTRWPWFTHEEGKSLYRAGTAVVGDPHLLLARFAREGIVEEIFTPNFDTLLEVAAWAVGLDQWTDKDGPEESPYRTHYRVIADRATYVTSTPARGVLRLIKFHGCAEKTHDELRRQEKPDFWRKPWNYNGNFVATYKELLTWRSDYWARDMLADRLRNHNVLFWGFSGVDAVLHATIRSISGEVHDGVKSKRRRFFAIDPYPGVTLKALTRTETEEANASPMLSPDGWITGKNPKADQEWIARLIFAETMKRVLEPVLKKQTEVSMPRWFPGKRAKAEADELAAWFAELDPYQDKAAMDLLWHTLPGGVALSWAARQKRAFHAKRRDIFWREFYVSLREHSEITLALLLAYHALWKKAKGRPIRFHRNGWVTVEHSSGGKTRHVSVLPVLLPEGASDSSISPVIHKLIRGHAPGFPGTRLILGLKGGPSRRKPASLRDGDAAPFRQSGYPQMVKGPFSNLDKLDAIFENEAGRP